MGYLYLSIALTTSKIKAYCSKRISGLAQNTLNYLLISTIRMLFCITIGFIFVLAVTKDINAFKVDRVILVISAVSGLSSATFVITWLLAIKTSAFTMLDVFLTLGIIVPLLLCSVFYGEKIIWIKWIGVAILIIAVYIMCQYSSSIKGKINLKGLALLIICGFSNGLSHFTEKWFSYTMKEFELVGKQVTNTAVFNFYTYVFAALALAICYLTIRFIIVKSEKSVRLSNLTLRRTLTLVAVMAFCLFMHSYFCTLAANHLSSSELYPLQQGLSLILSVVMSAVLFKEKITKKCIIGVVLTFIALIIINVLPNVVVFNG